MVYVQAARKTGAFMVLALVLSLAGITLYSGDLDTGVTGRVTSPGLVTPQESIIVVPFVLGVLVGALLIGTYFYIAHIERKREE
jgi:hypothetical protein